VWVDARAGNRRIIGHLVAGEGFAVAAEIAIAAVEAALVSRPKPGAHTPVGAFGPEFIAALPGLTLSFAEL
jgi:hypothetical protein